MNRIRGHLETAQLALMEAAAQARIDEDRAIYRSISGHIKPVIHAAGVTAAINLLIHQINHILDGNSNDN